MTNNESSPENVEEEDLTIHPLRMLKFKDYITFTGTLFGVFAILVAINGVYQWLACIFIFIATGCDLLDGTVARKFHQHNAIGGELDSLSDVIVFSVAPAALMYSVYSAFLKGTWGFPLLLACTAFYVFCGVLRLAWFNVNKDAEGYTGLVVPLAALFMVVYYLFDFFLDVVGWSPAYDRFLHYFAPFYMIIIGIFQIAPFLIYDKLVKKKQGIVKYAIYYAAITGIAIVILGIVFYQQAAAFTLAIIIEGFALLSIYVILGFRNFLRAKRQMPTTTQAVEEN